jgi:glyoxylase-like metal-dependent hydrolase (beta-lactamase superfamily II)
MKVFSIEGNRQKLDGGAMFGNCPRPLWEKWIPADEKNRIPLACRCLLIVEDSGRKVLLETGIGVFFEPKLRERFGVEGEQHVLLASLDAIGVKPEDIDVVVLSHLHFDHAGGALTAWQEGKPLELVFPKASYVVGHEAWARANKPHARDKASFIPELQGLLERTGRLEIVTGERSHTLGADYTFYVSHGHTPGLLLTRFAGAAEGPITFLGDLIPGAPWVHLPITMGYDRFPELLIEEKETVLSAIAQEGGYAFFTHDPSHSHAKITRDAKGKFGAIAAEASLVWG